MSFTPEFLDEIRARTPLADIIGRRVNLIRRGREHVALCPFHAEKTPSFTVNEDKGFFHCLAGETGVILRDGVGPIASLAGTSQDVLTRGGKWVRAKFKGYGIQKLYRIDLSRNGVTKSVFATSGHRWFVRGARRNVLTAELRPGHRLNAVAPARRSDWSLEPAGIRHGIVFGDGSLNKGRYGHVHLHGEKDANLARWFPEQKPQRKLRENGKPYLRIYGGRAFEHMKSLPSLEESDDYLLGFLAGYLAADGHVAKDGTVMLHSAKRANLEWVRAAATRLGIGTYGITTAVRRGLATADAEISRMHFVALSLDPALILGEVARQRFESAEKAFARLRWSVVAVEETDREEEVYCAEVPEEHAFALEDNILTGNCFGCGAHGDAIGFEMRIDNLGFPEAVERLARAAGLALPARTPEARERAKERTSLYAVLEAACVWFEAQLAGAGGKTAREYLAARGVDDATIAAFRLGWAPDSRTALKEALARQDISGQMMVAGGLLKEPEGGGAAYGRFRGRIIFPITDRSGRVVGFGGRALGDREPKYLNSPETPLFHKGQLLYGAALARNAAREASEVIVAEGYMDVIALHRAGFANAVAPLGTALTDEQIQELWRLAPEPVVCFDGDSAGHRAACRAAERALPLLEPGRSLRFVALPAGEDPDSLIARRGAQALREALAQARPLADLLWEIETRDRPIDTPERRAGVKKRLEKVAGRIRDLTVKGYYRGQFEHRLREAIRDGAPVMGRRVRRGGRGFNRDRAPERPLADALGSGAEGLSERRERLLVTMLLDDPGLLASVAEDFAALEFATPELDGLRRAILDVASGNSDLDSETLRRHLSARGMSAALERLSAPPDWSGRRLENGSKASRASHAGRIRAWRHVRSRQRVVALKAELHAAVEDYATSESENALKRIDALRHEIEQSAHDDGELAEPGMSPGGGTPV